MLVLDRYYFDYNATSPLAKSVKDFLAKGDFYFNPSSQHFSGKKTKSSLFNSISEIKKIFNTDWEILFHSGATEFINAFFKTQIDFQTSVFLYQATDHSAVISVCSYLKSRGATVYSIPSTKDGQPDHEALKIILEENSQKKIFVNFTHVNNETGIVLDFTKLEYLKNYNKNIYLHLDSAQVVGKILDWNKLNTLFQAITFSAHKFGGLVGVGFSFLNPNFNFSPFIHGGGQQSGLRGGTENFLGVVSTCLALTEAKNLNILQAEQAKQMIESHLLNRFKDDLFIVGSDLNRASTTSCVVFKKLPSDQSFIYFDQDKMDISVGSACSSGRFKGSHVIEAMGYQDFKNFSLRFSFEPSLDKNLASTYAEVISNTFQRLL